MDKLLEFLKQSLGGWSGLLTLGAYVVEAAAELAQKEGVDPDEFDRRVAELEAGRRTAFKSLVDQWRGMLKP